jgi:hypothetical protein
MGRALLRAAVAVPILGSVPAHPAATAVEGVVVDPNGRAIAGATVRIQATFVEDETDADGGFRLQMADALPSLRLTAWKSGYYVAGTKAHPGASDVRLTLEPHVASDHPAYEWVAPAVERSELDERRLHALLDEAAARSLSEEFFPLAERLALGCRDCHGALHEQWASSAHALGAKNQIFLTMYNGTDLSGNRSPPTRRGGSRDYGSVPLKPSPGVPWYGPGYKLDFPDTAGNCAACHLPGAAVGNPYGIDPNTASGVDAQGSHCDFCHKTAGVVLEQTTGRPRSNMPGVLSLKLTRPPPDRQLFFGPYDDVDAGPDTYLPLMKQSEICAPCHDASFWGVPIYESFTEWRASPYADRGETCQDCHMRPNGVTRNFAPGRGGVDRDPATIPTHAFPGAASETLLRDAVDMRAEAVRLAREVIVSVAITNDGSGHHVPTDSPLRQMLLVVRATDDRGVPLDLISGPKLPNWAGTRRAAAGHYAGMPGRGFAKILRDLWTGTTPSVAYWKPTRIVEDTRIAALATDWSKYRFAAGKRSCRVEVTLLFRRAFIELAEQKGWSTSDIVMNRHTFTLEAP